MNSDTILPPYSVSAHLGTLSAETELSNRALSVLSKIERARNDLVAGKVKRAIRSIRSAQGYIGGA